MFVFELLVIEELVGEIEDEFDRLPVHIHPCGTAWIMGGGVPITTAARTAGLDWSGKFCGTRVPALAEWATLHVPAGLRGGEAIERDGLRLVPRKFRRKKLSEAMIYAVGSDMARPEDRCNPTGPARTDQDG